MPKYPWLVGQGTQHRPDDISRVAPRPSVSLTAEDNLITNQGNQIQSVTQDQYYALNTASRIQGYYDSIDTTTGTTVIPFGATSVSIVVFNDSAYNVGVAFGGANAVLPPYSGDLLNTVVLIPGQGVVFPVHTTSIALVAAAANCQVRFFVALQ